MRGIKRGSQVRYQRLGENKTTGRGQEWDGTDGVAEERAVEGWVN